MDLKCRNYLSTLVLFDKDIVNKFTSTNKQFKPTINQLNMKIFVSGC
jgi:hypothetical protein